MKYNRCMSAALISAILFGAVTPVACTPSLGGCPLHGTERQSSKMKKSQIAGILFGVAMGVLFSVSMGTVGFVLGASFAILGMVMFKGLDDPQDKK